MTADFVITGKIYTADLGGRIAHAMAVKDGKLLAVGELPDVRKFMDDSTPVFEKSGLIVPGMVEGHAHISCSGEMVFGVALGHETDPAAYLEKIAEYAHTHPEDKVIFGSGYDNGVFGEDGPTAKLLDSVCADRPVIMVASDHHSRWVNSMVLELINAHEVHDEPAESGIVRYPDGRATGWLKESAAMGLVRDVLEPMSAEKYAQAIKYYQDIALANGITICFEPIFDSSHDYDVRAEGYKLLDERNELVLTCRLGYTLDPVEDIEEDFRTMLRTRDNLKDCKNVRLTTAKFFVDGVIECHTAFLREDYSDAPGDRGEAITSQAVMDDFVLRAMQEGLDVHTHVIGDAASDIAINAYERAQNALNEFPGGFRNALTHVQLLWDDQMQRMAENNIVAVVNPYWHILNPVYYDEIELPYLGEYRAANEYPVKSLLSHGISLSQASDFPVTVPPRTMDSLHTMVNRTEPGNSAYPPLNEKERIGVREALDILTRGGAYQLRLEDRKGSLEKGKDADFVVLTEDVFEMPAEELYRCEVAETWISGRQMYKMI